MARDLSHAQLVILCSEAERAAVSLRALPHAWSWFRSFGCEPADAAAGLMALAERGSLAEARKDAAHGQVAGLTAAGNDLARRYLVHQSEVRTLLRGLRPLVSTVEAAELAHHASLHRLGAPRLQGAYDQARRVADDLRRADHVLFRYDAGRRLADRAIAIEAQLAEVFEGRTSAERALAVGYAEAQVLHGELVVALRQLRHVWVAARRASGDRFPALVFELVAATAPRRPTAGGGSPKADAGSTVLASEGASVDAAPTPALDAPQDVLSCADADRLSTV